MFRLLLTRKWSIISTVCHNDQPASAVFSVLRLVFGRLTHQIFKKLPKDELLQRMDYVEDSDTFNFRMCQEKKVPNFSSK